MILQSVQEFWGCQAFWLAKLQFLLIIQYQINKFSNDQINLYLPLIFIQNLRNMHQNNSIIHKINTQISEQDTNTRAQLSTMTTSNILSPLQPCSHCAQPRIDCPAKQKNSHGRKDRRFQKRHASVHQIIKEQVNPVPNITFSYSSHHSSKQMKRSLSYNSPKLIGYKPVLTKVTHTVHPQPIEQIIYYPVIHNRLAYLTPQTKKMTPSKQSGSISRKRVQRGYLSRSIKVLDETSGTKEPMTPEQFKKMSEWKLYDK